MERAKRAGLAISLALALLATSCGAGNRFATSGNDANAEFVAAPIVREWPENAVPQFNDTGLGAAWSPEPGVLWVFTKTNTGCLTILVSASAEPDPQRRGLPEPTGPIQPETTDTNLSGVQILINSPELPPDTWCTEATQPWTSTVSVPPEIDEYQPLTINFELDSSFDRHLDEWKERWTGQIIVPPRTERWDLAYAAWLQPSDERFRGFTADDLRIQAGGFAPGVPREFLPIEQPEELNIVAGVAWTRLPDLLYVITFGSSSCPLLLDPVAHFKETITSPVDIEYDLSIVIIDFLETPANRVCTDDIAPTTSIVRVPDLRRPSYVPGVDNGEPFPVQVGDLGTVIVDPRPTEFQPGPISWLTLQ